jgi:hypothetical protein
MEVILANKRDHPLHKLGAPAMIFWTIIEIDHQGGDVSEPLTDRLPPLREAIHQAVTGDFRGHTVHKQFIPRGQEEPHGCDRRRRGKIVIGCCDLHTALPATGKGANLDGRLGVE